MDMEREKIDFDVLFVGGGPASLAGAIHLMQLARRKNMELEVALIEKGAEIGAHALSGAVMNPRALEELMPDYREKGAPIEGTVREDAFYFLSPTRGYKVPFIPREMHNKGFHIISLARFTRWLGGVAEEMGVNIFPGFPGKETLYGEDGASITGVRTGDQGMNKDGEPKSAFEPGIDLMAKVTVFGEGPRGSLMKEISERLGVFSVSMPQMYETGVKEVIQLPEDNYFSAGGANDIHTLGHPIGLDPPGGGFIYEMKDNRAAIGFLVGLTYDNPALDLDDLLYRFKRHPFVADIIKGGKVIEHGAKTVPTGGWFTMPRLVAPGALFVGACAAMHNSPALKGVHAAMKSGMLAAEAIMDAIDRDDFTEKGLGEYERLFRQSWLKREMFECRNFAQALAKKGLAKFIHLGAQYVTHGRGLRDRMPTTADHTTLRPLKGGPDALAPAPKEIDDDLYVDKLTGVYLSKTVHEEDQPCHLVIHDVDLCINECYPRYGGPCTRFCPANVYEIKVDEETGAPRLKLNPSNCCHCKTCDIKDPYGNITWTCPEGGGGPGYTVM